MKRIRLTSIALVSAGLIVGAAGVFTFAQSDDPPPAGERIQSATAQDGRDGDMDERRGDRRGWGRGEGRGRPDMPPPFWRPGIEDFMKHRMDEMRRENPEMAELLESLRRVELRMKNLAESLPPEKLENPDEEVTAAFKPLFEEHFELDVKRQRMEVEWMQERLDKLKGLLAKKVEHKDRFIELQMKFMHKKLAGDDDDRRGWGRDGRRGDGPPPDRRGRGPFPDGPPPPPPDQE